MDPTIAGDSLAASTQHREVAAALAAESDLDLAFRLQLAEAMAASLLSQPPRRDDVASASASSSANVGSSDADVAYALRVQARELERAYDAAFAREIESIPDDKWDRDGDNFHRPLIDDAISAHDDAIADHDDGDSPCRLYFKGTVVGPIPINEKSAAVVAAAVCDARDRLLLKIQKKVDYVVGLNTEMLEGRALLEGLNAAMGLGIKRVHVFMGYRTLYNHVMGIWSPRQQKVAIMINEVKLLCEKFESCEIFLVPRVHIKHVMNLVRDVIDSQINKNIVLGAIKDKETCKICLEITDSSEMHKIAGCAHCFCFSCMKQHVEVKLLHGMLPACPHDGCKTQLNVDNSKKFLTPKLLAIMVQRVKEESIPPAEKIYCPYPKCSALMSLKDVICPLQAYSSKYSMMDATKLRKCTKCNGSFCIDCKVPWHEGMSCSDYKRRQPHVRPEDAKLQNLAEQNLWRQCVKCKHMIELAAGCYHMTCRCGYEFCYTCGKEWKDKKATCKCQLWDERNIVYDDDSEDDDDDYDYDDYNDHFDEDMDEFSDDDFGLYRQGYFMEEGIRPHGNYNPPNYLQPRHGNF